MIIRIGGGHDKGTHWYNYIEAQGIDEREHAIKYAIETGKDIYVSISKKPYQKMTIEQLRRL